MKKLLLGLVLFLLVAVGGATFYVSTIDWNKYKGNIANRFAEMTGKNIAFDGPVSFKFLPTPYLTASKVKIFNFGNKGQPLVEIERLVASLSLSPLLKGNIDVTRMTLEEPKINVEVDAEGRLNWQSDLTSEQREKIEQSEIKLNSVSLEKATLNFDDAHRDITLQLDDLNGEVMADSVFGPFHVEGNYVKDNSPEGFALSVGKLSESFPTTLNFVVTHPSSESYVRFDGNFMPLNNVLNGNMIIETAKLQEFLHANFSELKIPDEYDYPLALAFDISTNDAQVNLSNMVIKYGETQGAGSIQLPLDENSDKEKDGKPRIEMSFNFADLNLSPLAHAVKDFVEKHKKGQVLYEPKGNYDWVVDIKSLKTQYKGQPIKNFETSFSFINDIININKLSAVLPGDTDVKIKGDVVSEEGEPFYDMDIVFNSNDFLKTMNWFGVNPIISVASTYKKALGNVKLAGTFNKIQIAPFNLTIDKSSLSGEAGIKLQERPDVFLSVNADMINFDNYIVPLSKEDSSKSLIERMKRRFSQMGLLNDIDMQITAHMDLGIYESLPFEKVDLKANLLNKKMNIEKFEIGSAANTKISLSGLLTGFGDVPSYENMKYAAETADVGALINKFGFKAPDFDYKQLKNFSTQGVVTGEGKSFALNSVFKLEDLDVHYSGQVSDQEKEFLLKGDLEVKHPDFVKMLNGINISYAPEVYSLGMFNLKTHVNGNADHFSAADLEANIGFNEFKGKLEFERKEGKNPEFMADLVINKFEIDRFLPSSEKNSEVVLQAKPSVNERGEFLQKPVWNKQKINYDFLKKANLSGRFKIADLSYKKYVFLDTESDVSLLDGMLGIDIKDAKFRDGTLKGDIHINAQENSLNGKLEAEQLNVGLLNLSGSRYGIQNGDLKSSLVFNSKTDSEEDFIRGLNGVVSFDIANCDAKNWNLQGIYNDVSKRENPEGLVAVVRNNLNNGSTVFSSCEGKLNFNNGEYSFSNASMKNNIGAVEVFGDGNLLDWTMNVVFNVKYNEPQYLPGYSFSLKGPMDAPLLDVNVSALFDMYKAKQDKIVADKAAAEKAERDRLQSFVDEQKKTAEVLSEELKNSLIPELETRVKDTENAEAKVLYEELREKMSKALSDVNRLLATTEEPSDDLIKQMAAENQRIMSAVEPMHSELDRALLIEQKHKMTSLYNKLIDDYNKSKMLAFDFNTQREKFNFRLVAVQTSFSLIDDAGLKDLEQFIEDKIKLLDVQNEQMVSNYAEKQKSSDISDITAYNESLRELLVAVSSDAAVLDDKISQYKKFAEEKVSDEEKKQAEKIRDAEVRRKVQENTGHINIKKTGKNITVKRAIEEIEENEKLTSEDKLPILDFSAPSKKKTQASSTKNGGVNVIKRTKKNWD